jgi:hypothetical protein
MQAVGEGYPHVLVSHWLQIWSDEFAEVETNTP